MSPRQTINQKRYSRVKFIKIFNPDDAQPSLKFLLKIQISTTGNIKKKLNSSFYEHIISI